MKHFIYCAFFLFVFTPAQAQEKTESNKVANQQEASDEKRANEKKSRYENRLIVDFDHLLWVRESSSVSAKDENRLIVDLDFRGNTNFPTAQLRDFMKYQRIGESYNAEKLKVDLDRLRVLLYADNGYLQVRFQEPEIEDTSNGLKITIPVNEGLCYRAGEIKVEDAKLMSSDEALQIIGLKTGDVVIGYSVVQKGLEKIKSYYTEHGYIHFNTDFIPEFREAIDGTNEATVDLTFDFEEGEAYSVGKIEFEGNITVSEALLRSNLLIREGDLYKPSAIDETVNRLYNLRLFDEVGASVDLETHEKERLIDITIRVKEKRQQ